MTTISHRTRYSASRCQRRLRAASQPLIRRDNTAFGIAITVAGLLLVLAALADLIMVLGVAV